MTILVMIKKYWSIAVGFGAIVLGFLLKISMMNTKKEEKRADEAEDNFEHAVDVMEKDNVIDVEFRSRRAAAKAEIKGSGATDELANPDDHWLRDTDDDG